MGKNPAKRYHGLRVVVSFVVSWFVSICLAIGRGPFIVYAKGNVNDPYYNTHEPGHVIQFLILKQFYYPLVAIPSLFTAKFFTEQHNNMPWKKSANQLWYWLTGEEHYANPRYF